MKTFATLACLLFVTTGFAQQRPSKQTIDSLGNVDNMPIHKGHGDAIDIPTRKGQGSAIDIPNKPAPVPLTLGEHSAMIMQSLKGQIEQFLADSSNRPKPDNTLPFKKN